MCGIAGVFSFNQKECDKTHLISDSVKAMAHRGPDCAQVKKFRYGALGHVRLSIIDTSVLSNQPFSSADGRFHLVFNGEIFNYKELRNELEAAGHHFVTQGDAEVLLQLFIREGTAVPGRLKGFFAFAVYDELEHTLFIARDRFGVKPLYILNDQHALYFASEVRALLPFCDKKEPDEASLQLYLQLNYIPGDYSIFKGIEKVAPGTALYLKNGHLQIQRYYEIKEQKKTDTNALSPTVSDDKMRQLIEESVRQRLIADVPVGTFLSGGIDSCIITGIAASLSPNIKSFCLGFAGNQWFDESRYAGIAAKKFKTDHHTFTLSNDDLLNELDNFLNALDEPFADSSALNVYILSKKTRAFVKTVLSGDGADEVFGGYNKHRAEWLIENSTKHRLFAGVAAPFRKLFPASRNSSFSNKIRQLGRFYSVMKLPLKERYWKLASLSSEQEALQLLIRKKTDEAINRKNNLLSGLDDKEALGSFMYTDVKMVLEGDMLVKADRMSMAHGLEIRSPFMDHEVIAYGLSLPVRERINAREGKLILKRAFSKLIPEELIKRKKHGFEVPLHQWMRRELRTRIEQEFLAEDFIKAQGIFDYEAIKKLLKQLFSENPADAPARVWALLIFNHWYKKNEAHF